MLRQNFLSGNLPTAVEIYLLTHSTFSATEKVCSAKFKLLPKAYKLFHTLQSSSASDVSQNPPNYKGNLNTTFAIS